MIAKQIQSTAWRLIKRHLDLGIIFCEWIFASIFWLSCDIVEKVRKLWLCGEYGKLFFGSIYKCSDGAYGNLQDIADFFITFSLYKCENDNSAIFLWKCLNNSLYRLIRFMRMKISYDVILACDFLYECLALLIFYIETEVIFSIFFPKMIDREIMCDTIEPT